MSDVACASCGAQIEFRRGPWSFHILNWVSLIGWQVAAFAMLAAAFMREWGWVMTVTAVAIGFEVLRAVLVRRSATIHWVNQESMRRRAAGQWVPE